MAYNSTYEEGDIAGATINLIVKIVLSVGTLITLVVVVFLYSFVKKKLN